MEIIRLLYANVEDSNSLVDSLFRESDKNGYFWSLNCDRIREVLEYAGDNGYITNAEQKRLTRKYCR